MYAPCASLFEYAFNSSVEFCSISYNHPSIPGDMCIGACATHRFYNRNGFIVHHLACPFRNLTSPYRTSLPSVSCKRFPAHNGTTQKVSFHQTDALLHPPSTSALLQVSQVLPASRVPRRHVLLHAVCESGLLGRRDGRARVGDGALEAVLVDFL